MRNVASIVMFFVVTMFCVFEINAQENSTQGNVLGFGPYKAITMSRTTFGKRNEATINKDDELGCKDDYFRCMLQDFRNKFLPRIEEVEEYTEPSEAGTKKHLCVVIHRGMNGNIVEEEFFLMPYKFVKIAQNSTPEGWEVQEICKLKEYTKKEVINFYVNQLHNDIGYNIEKPKKIVVYTTKNKGKNESIDIHCYNEEFWILKKLLKTYRK